MIKNIKKYLIIGLLFSLPLGAKALDGSFSLNCNKNSLKVGESARCYVTGKFDNKLVGAEITINSSSNISISNINLSSMGLQFGSKQANSQMGLSGEIEANTTVTFASFDAKLNSESTNSYVNSSLNSITDADYNIIDKGTKTLNISVVKEQPKEEPKPTNNDTNNSTINNTPTQDTTNANTVKEETKKTETTDQKEEEKKKQEEKKREEEKKKKEEEDKKKQEEAKKVEEAKKEQVTIATSNEVVTTTNTVGTTEEKSISKTPKKNNNTLLIITIFVCIIFVGVVGYTVYIKLKEKKQ